MTIILCYFGTTEGEITNGQNNTVTKKDQPAAGHADGNGMGKDGRQLAPLQGMQGADIRAKVEFPGKIARWIQRKRIQCLRTVLYNNSRMQKLNELTALCKAAVHLEINGHKGIYQTVQEYLSEEDDPIPDDVRAEMIKRDSVVYLQFYPNTPVGFYVIWHYDIEIAVQRAIDIINGKEK